MLLLLPSAVPLPLLTCRCARVIQHWQLARDPPRFHGKKVLKCSSCERRAPLPRLTCRVRPPSTSTLLPSTTKGKLSGSEGEACGGVGHWIISQQMWCSAATSVLDEAPAWCKMPQPSAHLLPHDVPITTRAHAPASPGSGTRPASSPGCQTSCCCSRRTPAGGSEQAGRQAGEAGRPLVVHSGI